MITTAPELIYMLKVNIGIALFYAFYKLFCCRDTFFQWRRIALLSFLALSFLYPLMDMQAWVKEQPAINELADLRTDDADRNKYFHCHSSHSSCCYSHTRPA